MPKFDKYDPYDTSIFIHELSHASYYRMQAQGTDLTKSDEPLSYSIQETAFNLLKRL